ncbi:hypothetical protein FRB91_001771 [Serendipita sp. 411]|nr:hypothetical protein FRB91_001771 [Serendipita sp. 411]
MKKSPESVEELLGEVRSLVIKKSGSIPKEISTVCPNITLLALHATNFLRDNTVTKRTTFPNLSTLQIVVSNEECLQMIGKWKMPSLKYLELTISRHFSPAIFLQEIGKGLISLQLVDTLRPIRLFDGIWSALPEVRYFGISMLGHYISGLPKPPPDHPLRTISNRELPIYNIWRRNLMDVVDTWTGIECISDTHSWEEVQQEILELERSKYHISKHGCDDSNNIVCPRCIYGARAHCERRNVRYEDAFGRIWAEYKQGYTLREK